MKLEVRFKRMLAWMLAVTMTLSMATGMKVSAAENESDVRNNIAEIGNVQYESLAEAIDNVAGGTETTIKLLGDTKENVVIPNGKSIILDLNGCTLTDNGAHTILNQGTLKIKDSGFDGTVDNITHARAALYNDTGATVTVEGGNFTRSKENGQSTTNAGGNSYYTILNHGEMTVNGDVSVSQGEDRAGRYSSMVENGWQDGTKKPENAAEASLTIEKGTFIGGLNTIKNDDYGNLTINGGTFKNSSQATILTWNVATINDGEFLSDKNVIEVSYGNDTMDKGILTIKGGTFNGKTAVKVGSGSGKIKLSIEGGTFSGTFTPANGTISGGTFKNMYLSSQKITDSSKASYDGTDTVVGASAPANYKASINDKVYFTGDDGANQAISKAVAAKANQIYDTVTLCESATQEKTLGYGYLMKVKYENNASWTGLKASTGCEIESTEADGIFTYKSIATETSAYAKIGDVYYPTISIAVANTKDGDEVIVLKDSDLGNSSSSRIPVTKSITIDLNGCIITSGSSSSSSGVLYVPTGYKSVVIKDSSENRMGTIKSVDESGVVLSTNNSSATLTIESGNIEGKTALYALSGTICVSGGNIAGGMKLGTSSTSTHEISISGGYYTADVTDYLTDEKILVGSDKSGYSYMVADKSEVEVEGVVVEPIVSTEGISDLDEEQKSAVEQAAKAVKATGLSAYANTKANAVTADDKNKAEEELKGKVNVDNGDSIKLYVQTYLDIQPQTYISQNEGTNTTGIYTLDIVPMYQLVASTATDSDDIVLSGEDKNAVVVGTAKELEVTGNVQIEVPLPTGFLANNSDKLIVKHEKDKGNVYYYDAVVSDKENYKFATFMNPNGFSKFTLMTQKLSSDADLSALSLSAGALSPVFDKKTEIYTATVDTAVTSISITPTASSADKSTIKVNDKVVVSGNASNSISLKEGKNTITVEVTAEDMTVKTYTITVIRKASTVPPTPSVSTDATLSGITLEGATLSPSFDKSTKDYTATVNNEVTSIKVTPAASDSKSKIKVNGKDVAAGSAAEVALEVGKNVITVEVTAEDGKTVNTYTITVTRSEPPYVPSANADLVNLTLSKGTLTPDFDTEKDIYTAVVPNSVKSITVTPEAADKAAVITVNDETVKSAEASETIALVEGENTITVNVTAEDGKTVKTYTVKVTRAAAKGKTYKVGGLNYKVTKDSVTSGTVTFTGYAGNKLTKLGIPKTIKIYGITYKVTAVGNKACKGKTKLKTITVGDNVVKIGTGAFYKCTNLKAITIGKNVTSIGSHVFCHDTKLRTMTINSTKLTKVGDHTLYRVEKLTIKAAKAKVAKYNKLFKGKAAKSYKVVKK